jgi:hypothetical protein
VRIVLIAAVLMPLLTGTATAYTPTDHQFPGIAWDGEYRQYRPHYQPFQPFQPYAYQEPQLVQPPVATAPMPRPYRMYRRHPRPLPGPMYPNRYNYSPPSFYARPWLFSQPLGPLMIIPPAVPTPWSGADLVRVQTDAGPIVVARHVAARFRALIHDLVAAGYRPRHIGCFAPGGHVPQSYHYIGEACDFDQRGWGLTHPFMYRAGAIIRAHGFRDGCSFNDCGHVDTASHRGGRR